MDNGIGGGFITIAGGSLGIHLYTFFQGTSPQILLRNLQIYQSSSYFYTVNVTQGSTYGFRYRALNINGWSGWSPVGYIKAATVPTAP